MSRLPLSFLRWTIGCGLAELIGISLAALWWLQVDKLNPEPHGTAAITLMLLLKGAAGLIEGTILGLGQGYLLRIRYPSLSIGRWTWATTLLAVAGWILGSAPSMVIPVTPGGEPAPVDLSAWQTVLLASGFGLAVGGVFGAAQWLVFRRAAKKALLWIPANMAGWAAALPFIYLAASSGSGQASDVLWRGLAGGLAAGLVLGGVTYAFLLRIEPLREA